MGNFGGGRYFDYTAYGDTINVAARLYKANKTFGTRICASADVVRNVPDFRGRPVGDLVLRGRAGPLRAFEPVSVKYLGEQGLERYRAAFALREANDPTATSTFAAHVGNCGFDPLANFQLRRLLNGNGERTSKSNDVSARNRAQAAARRFGRVTERRYATPAVVP